MTPSHGIDSGGCCSKTTYYDVKRFQGECMDLEKSCAFPCFFDWMGGEKKGKFRPGQFFAIAPLKIDDFHNLRTKNT